MVNLAVNKAKFAEVQINKRSWPSPQDYNEALQNPAINLADPLLKVGKAGLNKLGLPKAITGSFASVYYLDCPQQDFAVRCFLHNIADQKDRYAKISEYLNQIDLPIMADFDYLDKGVLAQGQWYPILKMDWVDGQNLIEYIGRNLDNAKVLEKLRLWLRQARKTLKEHGIAHGDLQHGNVLVTNDSIKLVDYDGMFVPALAGLPSNELGHRNYQHPGRTKTDFGPHLDNFSAWLIDTSLYCLERDPRLWFTLHAGEDCLLFREKDLQDPYSSFAFHELESHPNKEIQERVRFLRSLLALPVEQIPDINSEVQTPTDLPLLDASKKKPDWLSSAQHLVAEEVEPSQPVYRTPVEPKPAHTHTHISNRWLNQQANLVNKPPSTDTFGSYIAIVLAVLFFTGIGLSIKSVNESHSTPAPAQVEQSVQNEQLLFDKGTEFYEKGDYKSALNYYQQALTHLEGAGKGKTVEAGNCNYWIGRMQMQVKQFNAAFRSLSQAEAIYNEVGLTSDVAKVQHAYGLIYLQEKKFPDAIEMFKSALDGFTHEQSSQYNEDCKADVSYYLGWAYVGNHQDKEATQLFLRVIDYFDGVTDKQPDYVVSRLQDIARYFKKHHQASYAKKATQAAKHISAFNSAKP